MLVTSIQVHRSIGSNIPTLASVHIIFDGMLIIHDIKLLQNNAGPRLTFPSIQRRSGDRETAVHPIRNEATEALTKLVFAAYQLTTASNLRNAEYIYTPQQGDDLLGQEFEQFQYVEPHSETRRTSSVPQQTKAGQTSRNAEEKQVISRANAVNRKAKQDAALLKWLESGGEL